MTDLVAQIPRPLQALDDSPTVNGIDLSQLKIVAQVEIQRLSSALSAKRIAECATSCILIVGLIKHTMAGLLRVDVCDESSQRRLHLNRIPIRIRATHAGARNLHAD